jgi:hypothetical protein
MKGKEIVDSIEVVRLRLNVGRSYVWRRPYTLVTGI